MQQPVAPVKPDVTHNERHQCARPEPDVAQCRLGRIGHEMSRNPGNSADREAQQQRGDQPAQEVIAKVDTDPLAHGFRGMQREQSLQRNENRRQERQPDSRRISSTAKVGRD